MMKDIRMRYRLPTCLAFLALAAVSPALAGPASDAVRYFYEPVRWEADPEIRDRFTGPAKALFDANDLMPEGEMDCLGFAPSIDGQDFDDDTLAQTLELSEAVDGGNATVTATFQLFAGEEESQRMIDWMLVEEGGAWKVADIASRNADWALSEFACPPAE
jgi:hypothetical protein